MTEVIVSFIGATALVAQALIWRNTRSIKKEVATGNGSTLGETVESLAAAQRVLLSMHSTPEVLESHNRRSRPRRTGNQHPRKDSER